MMTSPDRNGERRIMAAMIAAGVVQIDSSRCEDPYKVAELSIEIADHIIEQIDAGGGESGETDAPNQT